MDVLPFLSKYALNMRASCFPALTARRRKHATTDLEILMLGDSHGWGQGAPGYDVIFPAYSSHMAVPYNKGFFAKLREHLLNKYDFYPYAIIPESDDRAEDSSPLIRGNYQIVRESIVEPVAAEGFYASRGEDRAAVKHLGDLAATDRFTDCLYAIVPEENGRGEAWCCVDMKAHATKAYIGVLAGRCGGRLEIFFREKGTGNRRNTGGYLYPQADGYPRVTRLHQGQHVAVEAPEVEIGFTSVVLDTYRPDGDEEIVYCIDYGQKQIGRFCLSYGGAHPDAVGFEHPQVAAFGQARPALRIRGIVFDGCDVRNFSMGGHTVGQWLGDGTASFNDPSYPHMDELLRFVRFTPTLAVIQAPIVNEYLRQTPIDVLKSNLRVLIEKLSRHLNPEGGRKTDILLFTTVGDKSVIFENAPSATIGYEEYFQAVQDFSVSNGYGFIDFERYFRENVSTQLLDYEFLYDDDIHPGPYANEFIGKMLAETIDLIM